MFRRLSYLILVLFLTTVFGCTKTFYIKTPAPSSIIYDQKFQEVTILKLNDQRSSEDKKISAGTLPVVLKNMENEMSFLGNNIEKALRSRGINLKYKNENGKKLLLNIHKYRIRNLRTSGFSSYWTFTTFRGDLIINGKAQKITFYFKTGKVPVMTFREVEEPCYNVPVSLMVKEIASKINRHYFGLQASSDKINLLLDDINNNFNEFSFLRVLELGYTNNRDAIDPLIKLTNHKDSMIRVCAISSLGVLGAVEKYDFLKNVYNTKKNIEKSMALKSIGDLETSQAIEFMKFVKESSDYQDKMIREVVDLYI